MRTRPTCLPPGAFGIVFRFLSFWPHANRPYRRSSRTSRATAAPLPAAAIRRGDRVMVKIAGEMAIKEMKRRTAKTLGPQSLNPDDADCVLAGVVEWIARMCGQDSRSAPPAVAPAHAGTHMWTAPVAQEFFDGLIGSLASICPAC